MGNVISIVKTSNVADFLFIVMFNNDRDKVISRKRSNGVTEIVGNVKIALKKWCQILYFF